MRVFTKQGVVPGFVAATVLATALLFAVGAQVNAQSNSSIAQEFKSGGEGITAAALVSLKKSDRSNTVELSAQSKDRQLVGVVSNKSAIELSEGGGVSVVTSGLATALVADINGTVRTGDKITASPVNGVGMKAIENGTVVGTAQANLSSVTTETRTITDKSGKKIAIHIGLIPVQVNVAFYSISDDDETNTAVPAFVQSIANSIAGRNVSAVRVITAGLLLLLVIACVAALLYGAVRSSIISIGRNPLSEVAVRKSLFQVVATALGVLLFAGIAVYLIIAI